jgi:hypothetical protein
MKIAFALLAFLFGAMSPAFQDGSTVDPRFTVKLQPVDDEEDITRVITITNKSQSPMVAVLVTCDSGKTPSGVAQYVRSFADGVLEDNEIYSELGKIGTKFQESTSFELHRPDFMSMNCNQETAVKAIVFADGSSFGSDEWVRQIIRVRQITWQNANDLIDLLQVARSSGMTKGQLIPQVAALMPRDQDRIRNWPESGVTVFALGPPAIFKDALSKINSDRKNADDVSVSQSLLDDLLEPLLDMRQRLMYSKPALVGIPEKLGAAGAPSPDYAIKIPTGLAADDADIEAFWTLSANGQPVHEWFDDITPPRELFDYRIHTLVAGQAAHRLQGAIYVPGCEIKFVDVTNISDSSGGDSLECVKLPTINFTGQVLPSDILQGHNFKIEITLYNAGDNGTPYFDFDLPDVSTDEHGVFTVELPDFSRDPGCDLCAPGGSAVIRFSAGGAVLAASSGAADADGGLHPMADYGGMVTFTARRKSK